MRRLTAATVAAVLMAGMLLTPASVATAQVPRKCRLMSQTVSGTHPGGAWTVMNQQWLCLETGWETRYTLIVH